MIAEDDSAAPRGAAAVAVRGYDVIERVDAGTFGVIYRARQHGIDREVAVKVIKPEWADHPEFVRRFETEAQLVARLEHPHIGVQEDGHLEEVLDLAAPRLEGGPRCGGRRRRRGNRAVTNPDLVIW